MSARTVMVDRNDVHYLTPVSATTTPTITYDASISPRAVSRDTDESGDFSESPDCSEYGTDFAAQLRKQRRQVLEKDEQKNLFAESLKKHRDHLVGAWEGNQTTATTTPAAAAMLISQGDKNKDSGGDASGDMNQNGSSMTNGELTHHEREERETSSILEALANGLNDDDDGDEGFGDFEDAEQGDTSKVSSVDDQFFESSMLTSDDTLAAGGCADSDTIRASEVEETSTPFHSVDNAMVIQSQQDEVSSPILSDSVGLNGESTVPPGEKEDGHVATSDFSGNNQVVAEMDLFDDAGIQSQHPTTSTLVSVDLGLANGIPAVNFNMDSDDNFFGDFTAGTNELEPIDVESSEIGLDSRENVHGDNCESFADLDASSGEGVGSTTDGDLDDTGLAQRTEAADVTGLLTTNEVCATRSALAYQDAGVQDSGDLFDDGNDQPQAIEVDDGPLAGFGCDGPCQLVQQVSADTSNEADDAFGTFEDPVRCQKEQEISRDHNDDDEFGDFDDSRTTPTMPLPTEGDGETAVVDGNDVPQTYAVPSFEDVDKINAVDNFETDILHQIQAETNVEDSDGDEFGDFDAAPGQPEDASSKPAETKNGDIFNGLENSAPLEPKIIAPDEEEREFGEFDDATPSDSHAALSVEINHTEDNFGDFGDAGHPHPAVAVSVKNEDDDAFGDFDDAGISHPQPPADDNDDNFGDFDEASPSQLEPPVGDDDDDFGDFDEALPSQPQLEPPAENDDDDDAFGDFDEAGPSQPQSSAQIENNDNSFGDFDDASPSQPQLIPPVENDDDDDDDDAFGDFDEADSPQPQTPVQIQGDGNSFGNFDYAPAVASETLALVAPMGDVGDKARSVFAKMQQRYSFPSADLGETSDDHSLDPETSLRDLLASSESKLGNKKSTKSLELLDQVLKGLSIPSGKSDLIIVGDGVGSYSSFIYPVGGLHSPECELEAERHRRSYIRTSHVPDILPIQLPTGRKMPLDASSPIAGAKKTSQSLSIGFNMPDLGIEEKGRNGAKPEPSSSSLDQLLSRIPDMNFMLQSSLSLQKK